MSTQINDKSFAGLPCNEQETARIYTSDTRFINKLDKLYERKKVHRNEDGITAVEYEVAEKLISFRSGVVKRNLTDEQRQQIGERLHRGRKGNT